VNGGGRVRDYEVRLTLPGGSVGVLWKGLVGGGLIGVAIAVVGGVVLAQGHGASTAIAHVKGGLLVGVLATLAISLAAMFFLMMTYVVNAGWIATMKRVFEQVALLVWLPALGVLLFALSEIASAAAGGTGVVSSWLNDAITQEEYFITKKGAYFNPLFVGVRLLVYLAVWIGLSRLLWGLSRRQERTGDRWLTNKAAFHSAWGLVVMALATAFFAFDWLKALTDYKFFSTMWGVYFFAGGMFAFFPAVALVLAFLRRRGRLEGLITEEHYHDLSKFIFGFTVFWAYIAYSQYFLIWYSAIPEETTWYMHRKEQWPGLTALLVWGHFLAPFYVMLWRYARRRAVLFAAVSVWLLFMHVVDIYWIIRPSLMLGRENPVGFAEGLWVDLAGIAGVIAIYAGVLVWRLTTTPLVNVFEPRLPEALRHKNYV